MTNKNKTSKPTGCLQLQVSTAPMSPGEDPTITLHKSLGQDREAEDPQKVPGQAQAGNHCLWRLSCGSTEHCSLTLREWSLGNIHSGRHGHQNDTPEVKSRSSAFPASWSSLGKHFTRRRRDNSYDPVMLASAQKAAFLGKRSHSML